MLIIDPGHGGQDPGGGSNAFFKEKEKVLQISQYQYDRFRALNMPVLLTRTRDETVQPAERTRRVRQSGATYCISNHINAGGGDGAETIYAVHASPALAQRLADEIQKEGQNVRRVFSRAATTQPNKDYYFMHRDSGNVHTVIVEYGFADSPKDDIAQLRTQWKTYAEAVVRGFCQHVKHPYVPPKTEKSPTTPQHPADDPIEQVTLIVRGKTLNGLLIKGKTYVEVRAVCEQYGDTVTWDPIRHTIEVKP